MTAPLFMSDYTPTPEEEAMAEFDLIPGVNVPVPGSPGSIGHSVRTATLKKACSGKCTKCLDCRKPEGK